MPNYLNAMLRVCSTFILAHQEYAKIKTFGDRRLEFRKRKLECAAYFKTISVGSGRPTVTRLEYAGLEIKHWCDSSL